MSVGQHSIERFPQSWCVALVYKGLGIKSQGKE